MSRRLNPFLEFADFLGALWESLFTRARRTR